MTLHVFNLVFPKSIKLIKTLDKCQNRRKKMLYILKMLNIWEPRSNDLDKAEAS